MAVTKIKTVKFKKGRKWVNVQEEINCISVSVGVKKKFDIEVDKDGDLVITANSNFKVKVLREEENELVIGLIKENEKRK